MIPSKRSTAFAAFLACGIVLGLGLRPAPAQIERPEGSKRLVRFWDFEDSLRHLEPVPENWYRAHEVPDRRPRPGFPPWNWGALDRERGSSGTVSVRLPTNGGSTSLMLATGVAPALPEAEYLIASRIRTSDLIHARARVVAWLLDAHLEEIPGRKRMSRLIHTAGEWEEVSFPLEGHPRAAWIQLELQLVQPSQYETAPRLREEVSRQDFQGAAWFDDLAIYQIPQLDLRTDRTGNVAVGDTPPSLVMSAHDLAGERLTAHVGVYDAADRMIRSERFELSSAGRRSAWTPELERYGPYRATMEVRSESGLVGRAETAFVWSPRLPAPDLADRADFGIEVWSIPEPLHKDTIELIRVLGVGSASIPVWREDQTVEDITRSVESLSGAIESLFEAGMDLTFVLQPVPRELARAAHLDTDDPILLFAHATPEQLRPFLDPFLTQFGERVRRWQIGATGNSSAFWRDDLGDILNAAHDSLMRLVPRPIITLPWRIEQRLDAGIPWLSAATIAVPPGVHGDAIRDYAQTWPDDLDVTLAIQTPEAGVFGTDASVAALVKQSVYARRAGVERLSVASPWSYDDASKPQMLPGAAYAAWRTIVSMVAGRSVVGELPIGRGQRAFILGGQGSGVIVAWNDWAMPQEAVLRGFLSDSAVTVRDPYGNTTVVDRTDGIHIVPLGPMPLFIEGIDVELAVFRSRMRFEPSFIASRAERHHLELVIENPWPVSITGRLRMGDNGTWSASPRVMPFTIGPGREARLPLEMTFGIGEDAGERRLTAEVEVTADRRYPVMEMPLDITLGLESVQLVPGYRYATGADGTLSDIIVTLLVSNLDDKPQTFRVFVQAPEMKTFQAPISDLAPGASEVRQFRLEGAADLLRGREVRVGLREQPGNGRINRSLLIR